MGISEEERARRVEAVRQARISSEMEGMVSDAQTRADQDEWAQGLIDHDEVMRRVQTRYPQVVPR